MTREQLIFAAMPLDVLSCALGPITRDTTGPAFMRVFTAFRTRQRLRTAQLQQQRLRLKPCVEIYQLSCV